MKGNPLVSVCIPTYNNARHIGKTLRSIINQTYKNIEIVVCDNASTDDTKGVIKSFSDERIKYYKNPKTIICLANWNLSIKLATAGYVSVYHSDDIYEPQIIEKELEFLENHPDVGAVFCLDKVIDENDIYIRKGIKLPYEIKNRDTITFMELFPMLLKTAGILLVAPTFMARKEIFNNIDFFDETEKFGHSTGSAGDTEMWLRISRKYKIGIIRERLIRRRVSITQGSNEYERSRITDANIFSVLDGYRNSPEIAGKIEKGTLRQYEFNKFWDKVIIAKNLIRHGRQNEAREILAKSFSPGRFKTGLRTYKNMAKLGAYFFLLGMLFLGLGRAATGVLPFLKRIYLKLYYR